MSEEQWDRFRDYWVREFRDWTPAHMVFAVCLSVAASFVLGWAVGMHFLVVTLLALFTFGLTASAMVLAPDIFRACSKTYDTGSRYCEFAREARTSIEESIREINAALEQKADSAFSNPGFDEALAACRKVAAILGGAESQRMWSELEDDIQRGNTRNIREYLKGLLVRTRVCDPTAPDETGKESISASMN